MKQLNDLRAQRFLHCCDENNMNQESKVVGERMETVKTGLETIGIIQGRGDGGLKQGDFREVNIEILVII